jgi:hypothetical protein
MAARAHVPLLLGLALACGDKEVDTAAPADTAVSADTAEPCEDPGTWYYDADGDGFGVAGLALSSCEAPRGYVAISGDCDDISASISPDAAEICDGIDNDCDGDADPAGTPGDTPFYADGDGDGYGDATDTQTSCSAPSGYVAVDGDCDDASAAAAPGLAEICGDGIDNNCDGAATGCEALPSGALAAIGAPFVTHDEAGASFGRAVSSADLDGDGIHDLIGGAYLGGSGDEGQAFVIHGPLSGAMTTVGAARVEGDASYDYAGWGVAGIPDLNGDGYDELAVSAIGATADGPGGGEGVVYMWEGPISGAAVLPLSTADAVLTYSPGRGNVGSRLWAGDLDGDGLAELLVGAATGSSSYTSGFWWVPGGAIADGELDARGHFFSEEDPMERVGEEVRVVPDTNGDGLDDVLMSATHSDAGYPDGGTVWLFLSPLPEGGSIGDGDEYVDGETSYGLLGQSLAGGDIDGDGYGDVLLGAYDDSVYTDYGGVAYVQKGPVDWTFGLGGSDVVIAGDDVSGRLANGLAVRDMDSDGDGDLMVSYTAAASYAGGVLLFDGPDLSGVYAPGDADRTWTGTSPGDGFLLELQPTGDLTGDGLPDAAFGLPSWSAGANSGAIAVLPASGI